MTIIVFLLSILSTLTALANCARPMAPVIHLQPEPHETTAAPASQDCARAINAMLDCIPFLSAGIVITRPARSCCDGYEVVTKSGADCVCQSFEGLVSMGIHLNMTKTFNISAECGIKYTPPVTSCNLLPPGADTDAMSPKLGSPAPSESEDTKFNIVPASPTSDEEDAKRSPESGAYSLSAQLTQFALNMICAASLHFVISLIIGTRL